MQWNLCLNGRERRQRTKGFRQRGWVEHRSPVLHLKVTAVGIQPSFGAALPELREQDFLTGSLRILTVQNRYTTYEKSIFFPPEIGYVQKIKPSSKSSILIYRCFIILFKEAIQSY